MRRLPLTLLALLSTSCTGAIDEPPGAAPGPMGSPAPGGPGPGSGPGSPDPGGSDAGDLPCEVQSALDTVCNHCHSDPPSGGAPMPLVSHADVHAPWRDDPSQSIWQRMRTRIADPERPMPPPTSPWQLDHAQHAALDAWFEAGAPARPSGASCGETTPAPEIPEGVDDLPCTPTHRFLAHSGDGTTPYQVPTDARDLYQCFTFRSPFAAETQATAWAPMIGDDRVVHHAIIWTTRTPQVDGGVGPCVMPSDSAFLMGWAPGGGNWVMPEDVGLETPNPGEYLILQLHYNNYGGFTDSRDDSGFAICTADEPRPNEAGIVTLGALDIAIPPRSADVTVTGSCPPSATATLPGPIQVMASFPHMHGLGVSVRTEIARAAGGRDMMVNVDRWDFSSQVAYAHDPPITIHPGDDVITTCVYDNPTDRTVFFGERTEDEMCFNFVMVYPLAPSSPRWCIL